MRKSAQPFCECKAKFKAIKELEAFDFDSMEETLEVFRLLGAPFVEVQDEKITLETNFTPVEKQRYCIVDIETNGSKPLDSQIIEIGAVMIEGTKEIDRFESFVYADAIPHNIVELTQITVDDVEDAPSLKSVLERFRLFLSDAVFVAHNVNFDYGFISHSMEKAGFGPLLNRKLCSIDLARKCIEAPRYGLGFLIEHLGLEIDQHHRALSDARAAKEVFALSLENLPEHIITAEDLIYFAKPNIKKRKKKKEA